MGADDMETRTPAPEGEAVAWRWRWTSDAYGVEGASPGDWAYTETKPSVRPAEAWRKEVQPLYASPVVLVGVRERVLDELDKAWLHGQRRTSWRRDESADAILAALRPTDTGRG
jgi:hypothetical protein